MLFELAIADAYSQQWNNRSTEFIQAHNDLSSYATSSNGDDESISGYYTGTTQMNIAIAKMLVLGHPWVKEFLTNSFVVIYKRDPRLGYPKKLEHLLSQLNNGSELIDKIDPYDTSNTSLIRAMPIGILSTPEKVIKATIAQTAITNNNPNDLNASIAIALMTHYFIYRSGKKEQLLNFLDIYVATEWLQWHKNKITDSNLIASALAIEAIIEHHSLSQLLKSCIETADKMKLDRANSLAAIAIAAASCSEEYQQDLPPSLVDNLENTNYGKSYLIELDRQMMALVN